MSSSAVSPVTAYDLLGVHPFAPLELVSACYWLRVKQIREQGDLAEPERDAALHRLSLAYQEVSEPSRRARYDARIGCTGEPLTRRRILQKRSLLGRARVSLVSSGVDPYEVIGLSRTSTADYLPDAYRIMRDRYLRAPVDEKQRAVLLTLLDESLAVLSDDYKRQVYAAASGESGLTSVWRPDSEPEVMAVPEGRLDASEGRDEPGLVKAVAEAHEHASTEREVSTLVEEPPSENAEPATVEGSAEVSFQESEEGLGLADDTAEVAPDADEVTAGEEAEPVSRIEAPTTAEVAREDSKQQRKVAPPPPARNPTSKRGQPDVEEVLLGRLASSVKEQEKTSAPREDDATESTQS